MQIAQQLYEGIDIGGETVGLITYMRTDGLTMAGEAIAEARQVIGERYGKQYVPSVPARLYQQGEERPGSARGHPADQLRAHAGNHYAFARQRPGRGSTS